MMDGCFKILMEQVHGYGGAINQFTGDGIMALFGAPISHEDHAQRACYAPWPSKRHSRNIRNLFVRESQNKPITIVVEDLHWIDRTSEEFLDYLIGWLASTRILLILLYRPEYTHHWESKSYYTRIKLNQLGTESSKQVTF